MKKENLGNLLNELAEKTTEPVRPELAEDIKETIPQQLTAHKAGMDTISIIIDLRINKLAAAAVIILTLILCANIFNVRDSSADSIYQEGRLLIRHCFGGKSRTKADEFPAILSYYEDLLKQGKAVVYYGNRIKAVDNNAVLMYWKLSDNEYKVILGDLSTSTVNADELVELQSRMLQNMAK